MRIEDVADGFGEFGQGRCDHGRAGNGGDVRRPRVTLAGDDHLVCGGGGRRETSAAFGRRDDASEHVAERYTHPRDRLHSRRPSHRRHNRRYGWELRNREGGVTGATAGSMTACRLNGGPARWTRRRWIAPATTGPRGRAGVHGVGSMSCRKRCPALAADDDRRAQSPINLPLDSPDSERTVPRCWSRISAAGYRSGP
jgi:hypothetical protein